MAYTLRTFDSVSAFVEYLTHSVQQSICDDGWYTNMILGNASDHLGAPGNIAGFWSVIEQKVPSVQAGQVAKRAILTMFSKNLQLYNLCAFQPVDTMTPEGINYALAPLLTHLRSTLSSPSEIKTLFGPNPLLDPFRERWRSIYAPQIPPLALREQPFVTLRLARASFSTLTSANPHSASHPLREGLTFRPFTAAELEDKEIYDQTFDCVYGFMMFISRGVDPDGRMPGVTASIIRNAAQASSNLLWICVDGAVKSGASTAMSMKPQRKVLGYTLFSRETPNTISFGHVFTHPDARGAGIAAALVVAASRFWLQPPESGEAPQEPSGEPRKGAARKEFACLFVAMENPQAERLYRRCGFEILDEQWGEVGWEGISRGDKS